ncbi:TetR/AcrR family transcriptional regulator [Streptomyces sp. NPDC049040]|uniref:TetR/AcrR family transcriptional regulator n=1 Tax=Streptomyces sp. NPDC049040 TaxID=3365593 RepID=UPI003713FEB0
MDTPAVPEPPGTASRGPAADGDAPGAAAPERRLTPKGRATREKILEAAAALIHRQGAHLTNNESVRRAAGVSGSQLMRHFPTKESLVRGVIVWQADAVVGAHRELGVCDGLPALRRWAQSYADRDEPVGGGCSFGALAGEVLKVYPEVREDVAEGFARWEEVFRSGLQAMVDRGELGPDADPARLARLLLAAFQGGMLLDQAAGDSRALPCALDGAISYIATFTPPARRAAKTGLGSP